MAINIGKGNFKAQSTDIKDYVNYVVDKRLGEFEAHMKGEDNKHNAKDIVVTDDNWVIGENVQEAINYLGKEENKTYTLVWNNKERLDSAEGNIKNLTQTVQGNANDAQSAIDEVNNNLDEAKENIRANSNVIENLAECVDTNASAITKQAGSISANRAGILSTEKTVSALTQTVEENKTAIAANKNLIDTTIEIVGGLPTKEWVGAVEDDLANKDEWINTLETEIEANTERINTLFVAMPNLEMQVQTNKVNLETHQIHSDNTYANALKGVSSGTAIRLDDVSPVKHELGVKVRSKNIIPTPYRFTDSTIYDCRAIVNEDFSVTVSGIPSSINGSAFTLQRVDAEPYIGKAIAIIPTEKAANARVYVHLYDKNGKAISFNWLVSSDGTKTTGIVPENAGFIEVGCAVLRTFTGEPLTLYPCVVLGTSATEWVPYVEDISAVKLKAQGKNLLDINNPTAIDATNPSAGSHNATYEVNNGVATIINAPDIVWTLGDYGYFEGKMLTASVVVENGEVDSMSLVFYGSTGECLDSVLFETSKTSDGNRVNFTCEVLKGAGEAGVESVSAVLCFSELLDVEGNAKFKEFQVELGDTATEYESYKNPVEYEVRPDGTVYGVTSISPTMTLLPDTSGAIIDVEYNKDSNKVIEKLTNAIIALGGNV